jgi:hypothetical protein
MPGSVQQVEFLAGLKAHGFAGGDADFGAGSRIPPNPGLPRAHIEHPKAPQLDPLAFSQGPLQGLENGVHGRLGLVPLQTGPLNHLMNNVLFYQGFLPSRGLPSSCLMLETFSAIVNAATLS